MRVGELWSAGKYDPGPYKIIKIAEDGSPCKIEDPHGEIIVYDSYDTRRLGWDIRGWTKIAEAPSPYGNKPDWM